MPLTLADYLRQYAAGSTTPMDWSNPDAQFQVPMGEWGDFTTPGGSIRSNLEFALPLLAKAGGLNGRLDPNTPVDPRYVQEGEAASGFFGLLPEWGVAALASMGVGAAASGLAAGAGTGGINAGIPAGAGYGAADVAAGMLPEFGSHAAMDAWASGLGSTGGSMPGFNFDLDLADLFSGNYPTNVDSPLSGNSWFDSVDAGDKVLGQDMLNLNNQSYEGFIKSLQASGMNATDAVKLASNVAKGMGNSSIGSGLGAIGNGIGGLLSGLGGIGGLGGAALGALLGSMNGSKKIDDAVTTQNTTINQQYAPYLNDLLGQGSNLFRTPQDSTLEDNARQSLDRTVQGGNLTSNPAMHYLTPAASGSLVNTGPTFQQQLATANGQFLNPQANPYLSQFYDRAAGELEGKLSPSFGHMQAFGGNSGYNLAKSRGLADLGTSIYGGQYNAERDRMHNAQQSLQNSYTNDRQQQMAAAGQIGGLYGNERGLQQQASGMVPAFNMGNQLNDWTRFGQFGNLLNGSSIGRTQTTSTPIYENKLGGMFSGAMAGNIFGKGLFGG